MLFWLMPPLAWFSVFMLIPYAMLFYYSLGSVDYMTFKPGFSAANFVRIFTTEPYLGVLLKSIKLGLITAAGSADAGVSGRLLHGLSNAFGACANSSSICW